MFSWLKKVLSERASSSPKSTLQLRVETPIERSLEIAQELAKPCVLLKREGDKLAAVWGGRGTVSGPEGYRHWLSVDCSLLPTHVGLNKGVISIYSGGEDWDSGVVEYESNTTLSLNEGIPLYAHNALSMLPPDAHDDLDTDAYIKKWMDHCPVYIESATAVIGGWHFPWPDGDWEELCQKTLVLWTIEGSEPWIEVWKDGETFRVCERVT